MEYVSHGNVRLLTVVQLAKHAFLSKTEPEMICACHAILNFSYMTKDALQKKVVQYIHVGGLALAKKVQQSYMKALWFRNTTRILAVVSTFYACMNYHSIHMDMTIAANRVIFCTVQSTKIKAAAPVTRTTTKMRLASCVSISLHPQSTFNGVADSVQIITGLSMRAW
jgi:hypothetical protein